ncbi:MAG: hypothetical protein KAT05_15135 [Spirochaetes bacterium]|nr:hypothetical protein [Spirochaetota bacterium]
MTWKKNILITLISFVVGLIIGWQLAFESKWKFVTTGFTLVGFLIPLYIEHRKEQTKETESQKEKQNISGNLLSEVEVNQKILQPISYGVSKALDNNNFSDDDKLTNELIFSRNVYSALSGKLGLISKKERDKTHQYYSKLKHIDEEYKKLGIQGRSYPFLVYLQLRQFFESKTPKPRWHEIEEFLGNTKKVYDLGAELIIDFNETTGIKPLDTIMDGNRPLTKKYLQKRYPDIRKVWFEEIPELKTSISEDERLIKKHIENKLKDGIQSYSLLKNIFDSIFYYKELSISKTKAELIYELLDDFATNGQVPEKYKIEQSKKTIEIIVNDKTLYEMFERVNKNNKLLNNKIIEFEQFLEKMRREEMNYSQSPLLFN